MLSRLNFDAGVVTALESVCHFRVTTFLAKFGERPMHLCFTDLRVLHTGDQMINASFVLQINALEKLRPL